MTSASREGGRHVSPRRDTAGRVGLPRRRWTPGRTGFRLRFPAGGIVLGSDSAGHPAAFPLLVPTQSTRVGVVGPSALAQLLALRLAEQACHLTVVTSRHEEWQRFAASKPESPIAITHQLRRWPPDEVVPPWALLIDMPEPPPTGFTRDPWSTVIHLVPRVPAGSGWWQSAQLIVTGRADARAVSAIRPRLDSSIIERMGADDLVAIDSTSVTVFRPAERAR